MGFYILLLLPFLPIVLPQWHLVSSPKILNLTTYSYTSNQSKLSSSYWILDRYTQLESEKATDEWVLQQDICAFDYADQLVQLTRQINQRQFRMAVAMSASKDLQKRIEAILKLSKGNNKKNPAIYWNMLFFLSFSFFGIACLELEPLSSELAWTFENISPEETGQLKKVIWQAGEQESVKAVPYITTFLQHSNPGFTLAAVQALADIGLPSGMGELETSFASCPQGSLHRGERYGSVGFG